MKYDLAVRNKMFQLTKRTPTCWLWVGYKHSQGYGRLKINGKMVLAHRVAYALSQGDPGELDVLHSCDNPACVNPDHLSLGTHQDNMDDMNAKGRHGSVIIPDEVVAEIRALKGVLTQQELADKFGISAGYVSELQAGKHRVQTA